MNVIPFPRQAQAPLAFAIGARLDLRVGAVASGVVRPRGAPDETFAFSSLARLLRAARMAWRERGVYAPLTLKLPARVELDASLLDEAALEAGCTRHALSFEMDEAEVIGAGAVLAEELRARGWSLSLNADPTCPLPFGARVRALFSELVLEAPDPVDPFFALDGGERSPLCRRVLAAKGAGLTITAEGVRNGHHAKALALAGFERGAGPFAESGLRQV